MKKIVKMPIIDSMITPFFDPTELDVAESLEDWLMRCPKRAKLIVCSKDQ